MSANGTSATLKRCSWMSASGLLSDVYRRCSTPQENMSTFETDEHLQAPLHSRLAAECDSCHRARVQLISLCSETPSESDTWGAFRVGCVSGLRSSHDAGGERSFPQPSSRGAQGKRRWIDPCKRSASRSTILVIEPDQSWPRGAALVPQHPIRCIVESKGRGTSLHWSNAPKLKQRRFRYESPKRNA
jgi:hypothetical protein